MSTATSTNSGTQQQVLIQNHQIREHEHKIGRAQSRARLANLTFVLGPILFLVLYTIYWIPEIPVLLKWAIYIPALPVALICLVATYALKVHPGYPTRNEQNEKVFVPQGALELDLARLRDERKQVVANLSTPYKVRRVSYKEDAASDVNGLRQESNRYRMISNFLQGILIVGSLAATLMAGLSGEFPDLRWATAAFTFTVGVASGFMAYFKFKERSFYLQQTADAIKGEWEAVEIGVGRYKNLEEEDALADFVEEVHRLKGEQRKRQQNLEQPAETKSDSE